MRVAARAWNRSGVRVKLVEVSRSKAKVLIRPMRKGACFGQIGIATVGYTPGVRRPDAAAGVVSRGHADDDRRARARPHPRARARGPALRPDEQRVRLPLPPAAARVGVVLLAAARRRPARRPAALRRALPQGRHDFCASKTLPGTVQSLGDAADPVDSLARVRLSFQTPSSTSLRRVVVTRRRGRVCGDTPVSRSVPIVQREGVTPRLGTLVAEIAPAARSAVISVEDLAVTGNGTWCYAVFTLDRRNRWRLAGPEHREAWPRGAAGEAHRPGRRRRGADRHRPAVDEPADAADRRAGAPRRRRVPGRTRRPRAVRAAPRNAGRGDVHRCGGRAGHAGATACGSRRRSPARDRRRDSCRSPA